MLKKEDKSWVLLLAVSMVAVLIFSSMYYPSFVTKNEKSASMFFDEESSLINLNTAPNEELALLPGIGKKTANNIVEFREANGPFETLENLLKVKGVGKSTLKKIENLVCF